MKYLILWTALLTLGCSAIANEKGNGGDPCEDRIQEIRDDIRTWIQGGGSKGLQLPSGLSLTDYNSSMLAQIGKAQIACTDSQVTIDSLDKVCENATDSSSSKITCNRQAFLKTSDAKQYILVHHEYAGLAGFEISTAGVSNYSISNQLSAFLQASVTLRLTIKPQAPQPPNDILSNFKDFVGTYRVLSCQEFIDNGKGPQAGPNCGFSTATLFFGDNYQPNPDDAGFFLDLSSGSTPGPSVGLVSKDNDPGDHCTTFYGTQFCDSLADGNVINARLWKDGDKIQLEWTLSWPDEPNSYFYHSISMTLEKIDLP